LASSSSAKSSLGFLFLPELPYLLHGRDIYKKIREQKQFFSSGCRLFFLLFSLWKTRESWGKRRKFEKNLGNRKNLSGDISVLKVTKSHTVKVCLIGLFIILKLGIFVFSYYILQG
jgi:hypothetical protein